MLINILSGNLHFFNTYALIYPFLRYRRQLRSLGIRFNIYSKFHPKIRDCNILILDSKAFRDYWHNNADLALEKLDGLREGDHKLLWFNSGDSTGLIQNQVIDIVDRYYKNQLLHDRSAYARPYYGGRTYTDYYHRHADVNDLDVIWSSPLNADQIQKLRVSWNLGLSPFVDYRTNLIMRLLPRALPRVKINPRITDDVLSNVHERTTVVTARMSTNYARPSIAYQRKTIAGVLHTTGVPTSRIPARSYFRELLHSQYAVSPFGWGEVCIRDFEAVLHGCVLVKPDMDHIETWPNIYIKNKTYIPLSWDLTFFDEWINDFLCASQYRDEIAAAALDQYKNAMGDPDGVAFVGKITDLISDLDLTL
jgi:hypothetical protein